MSDWQTAVHEAAHLVACFLLLPDEELVRATVVPLGTTAGQVVHRRARELSAEEQAARDRANLIVCLAGEAACRGFADPASGCEGDDDEAFALAIRLAPGRGWETYQSARQAGAWLCEDHWQAITDIAKELERFGTFEGAGLTRMVRHYTEQDRASPWCEANRRRHRETRARLAERRERQQNGSSNDEDRDDGA